MNEIQAFVLDGAALRCEPYGEGHINETFYVVTDRGARYILQRVNTKLFADIEGLMRNIAAVTGHIAQKLTLAGESDRRKCLRVVSTGDGRLFSQSDAGVFRMYEFIGEATAYQQATPALFYESARAFGAFQNCLADFDASVLIEPIPRFHDTRKRLNDFKASLQADCCGRAKDVQREIDFVLSREPYAGRVVDLLQSGDLPLRVTHNDTKLNNVMIDDATGKALAVIDLDTVMPGSSCYDFGDSIRFGCNTGLEDERDLTKVNFSLPLFISYAEGYLGELKAITQNERDVLAFSSILMTYECGMRFLADHLGGDTYFRIKRDNHNLDRARTQFKLISDMEKALPEMEKVIASL